MVCEPDFPNSNCESPSQHFGGGGFLGYNESELYMLAFTPTDYLDKVGNCADPTSTDCGYSYNVPVYGNIGLAGLPFLPPTPGQPQTQTTSCTVSNGRTTAPNPGQATGPGAFGLYPSRHPGMVAIDPMALGLFAGRRTNDLLRPYVSQITFTFSPTPNLPARFPTTFTVGDIVGGTPNPRAGGPAYNGYFDFDIYALPSGAAAGHATSQPVAVRVTFPSSLPINCGGPIADPIPANPGLASNQRKTDGALSAYFFHLQRYPSSPSRHAPGRGRSSLQAQARGSR